MNHDMSRNICRAIAQPSALAEQAANVGQSRSSHCFSRLVRLAKIHQRRKVARLLKSGGNGTGKNGKFVPNCPTFSNFSPASYQFHTFFLHSPQLIFGNFPEFPISPIFPFPPFSFPSAAS